MAGTPGTPRVLRAMNDRAALDLLLAHGPLSRTRIGDIRCGRGALPAALVQVPVTARGVLVLDVEHARH